MVKYEPLSEARPPSPVRSRTESLTNYETEPVPPPPYSFDKTYTYDKYMPDYPPTGTITPSNSSQVDILSTFAESNSHQTFDELRVQSATGFGAGLVCLSAETLVGYPFLVLRRQCQVNAWCKTRDLSPLLMLKAIFQIQQGQGCKALWKGFTCHMMYEGLQLSTDTFVNHITDLPKELPSLSQGFPKFLGYITLKSMSTLITLPVLSTVVLDTVQSESARFESASPMSCLKDTFYRISGRGSTYQYRLLVPFHQLILPTVLYTLSWDIISQVVHSSVLKLCKMRQNKSNDSSVARLHSKASLIETVWPELLAGTVHCFVADLALLPLELVMNRLHLQGTRAIVDNVLEAKSVIPYQSNYSTVAQCIESLVESEGGTSFWKGLSALLLQYTLRFTVVHTAKLVLRYVHIYSKTLNITDNNNPNDSLSVNLEK